jgi:aspartate/methionine/tyrosine aminotransferase
MKITPFHLERFYDRYEFSVGTNISASCGAETTTADLFALSGDEKKEEYLSLGLGYRENRGDPLLREKIAAEYDTLTADDIQVTIGGSEAIYLLMMTYLESGDRVISETPIYQSLFQLAQDRGIEVDFLTLYPEEEYLLDPGRLESLLKKKKTAMVVINHPHSPTGSILSRDRLREIVALTEKHGALLVSDEVYWGVFHEKDDVVPHAADLGEDVVTIGDMTKPYGLGGLRVGWLATKREDVLSRATVLKDYMTMNAAGPSEFLSIIALSHKEKILERNIGIARKNIEAFDALIKRAEADGKKPLSWVRPSGGYTGFVKLDIAGVSVEEFCLGFIKDKDVLLLPGRVFGDPERFRIGVGTKNDEFSRGVDALSDFLKRF